MDDYDLVAGATNPLLPSLGLLRRPGDIGLHAVLARSADGAGRAMLEPVVQRLREMGTPTLLMSASKDEGQLFEIKPQPRPLDRGYLIVRRSASPPGADRAADRRPAGQRWPAGRQCHRRPRVTTAAAATTRAPSAAAPPAMHSATILVTGFSRVGCGTVTGGAAARAGVGDGITVTSAPG